MIIYRRVLVMCVTDLSVSWQICFRKLFGTRGEEKSRKRALFFPPVSLLSLRVGPEKQGVGKTWPLGCPAALRTVGQII